MAAAIVALAVRDAQVMVGRRGDARVQTSVSIGCSRSFEQPSFERPTRPRHSPTSEHEAESDGTTEENQRS
jgi:hypothetical protein